jgi:hypothetical protein
VISINQKLSVADVAAAAARLHGARAHPRSERARVTESLAFEDLRVVVAFVKGGLKHWAEKMERELERFRDVAGGTILELRHRIAFLENQRGALEGEVARLAGLLDACADETGWRPGRDAPPSLGRMTAARTIINSTTSRTTTAPNRGDARAPPDEAQWQG